jgi:hypothetical protein
MAIDRHIIEQMLASMSKDVKHVIDRTTEQVRADFTRSGGQGSSRMYVIENREIAGAFRAHAAEMATKARDYGHGDGNSVADLVDTALGRLIDAITHERSGKYYGRYNESQGPKWQEQLNADLVRFKDDVVRDLRHMPSDKPIGVAVTVTGNQGPVNVAAGVGSTASQALKGVSLADLVQLLAEVRSAVLRADLSESGRTEILDQVEVIEGEVAKSTPDQGKLVRWAKRLAETGEKMTVAAVPKLLESWLKTQGL